MSPGEPAEKSEKGRIYFLDHSFTPESLAIWLEQRVEEGDVNWVALCYEGRNGPRLCMAEGTNATMAFAGALMTSAAIGCRLSRGPDQLDPDYRHLEDEDGSEVQEEEAPGEG